MPRYAEPPLPPEVETIVRTLGINRIRMAILITLAQSQQGLTTSEIAERAASARMTITDHLRDLEHQGAVTASMAPNDPARRRATITWSLNRSHVREELAELGKTLGMGF